MLEETYTRQCRKDIKLLRKQGKDKTKFDKVVLLLKQGVSLPIQYRDHALSGAWSGFRECHITPDWLLIYEIDEAEGVLNLIRTGSHSELFESVSAVQKLNQSLDEVLANNSSKLENLCKRPSLGSNVRELLQPENLVRPFDTVEDLMRSVWGDDDK